MAVSVCMRPQEEAMAVICPHKEGFAYVAREIGGVYWPDHQIWWFDTSEETGFHEDAVMALLRRFYEDKTRTWVIIHRNHYGPIPVNTCYPWPDGTATNAEIAMAGERRMRERRPGETPMAHRARLRQLDRTPADERAHLHRLIDERAQLVARLLELDNKIHDFEKKLGVSS